VNKDDPMCMAWRFRAFLDDVFSSVHHLMYLPLSDGTYQGGVVRKEGIEEIQVMFLRQTNETDPRVIYCEHRFCTVYEWFEECLDNPTRVGLGCHRGLQQSFVLRLELNTLGFYENGDLQM
jgi:hypothetical protein